MKNLDHETKRKVRQLITIKNYPNFKNLVADRLLVHEQKLERETKNSIYSRNDWTTQRAIEFDHFYANYFLPKTYALITAGSH